MEDLWQKFRQETEKDLTKIRNFLDEISSDETSPKKITVKKTVRKPVKKATMTAKPKVSKPNVSSRKKIYGKLSDLVREIMEKENLSRAQAYRLAKKRFLNNF